ncbi:RIP metalloprotease RseP [Agaribacter flavus]|uniref:Zinc metalloprotease n=1 Tax=Agaribacter flavus TaxID=1902781 RepID=A0ABV7FTS3_9ALTE
MMSILNNLFYFIVALSILVAVHEWGHYFVAKLCKVKILRFSIGFGKPLYKRTTSTGMEFVIAAIPLGGYVRMLDGRVDDISETEKAQAFNHKPISQRFAIVAAGPLVNIVFAVLVLMSVGMIGQQTIKPVIGELIPDSVAAGSGLASGDQIIAVGDRQTFNWRDVGIEIATFSGEDFLPLKVLDKNMREQPVVIALNGWKIDSDSSSLFSSLGFTPYRPAATSTIAFVADDSPASRAGMAINDEILRIDGTSFENWSQIVDFIEQRPLQKVDIEVSREGQRLELAVTTGQHPEKPDAGYLGVIPFQAPWPSEYIENIKLGFVDAFVYGLSETARLVSVTVEMLGKLITGDISVKNLSGPISIAQGAGTSASAGLVTFLTFLALISVNLGIINLLPLPILDGGHLMYFTVEWLTGKPVSEAVQDIGFRVGGALLFVVMATAIFNDILRNI